MANTLRTRKFKRAGHGGHAYLVFAFWINNDIANGGKPIELDSRDKILQTRLANLQKRFVSRLVEDRAGLVRARDSGDNVAVRELAHRLAGVSGSFGYPKIGDAAVRLQAAIDFGHEPGLIRTAIDRLVMMLEDPGSYME